MDNRPDLRKNGRARFAVRQSVAEFSVTEWRTTFGGFMRTMMYSLSIGVIGLGWADRLPAQEPARAVIEKGISALGGDEQIERVKAWQTRGRGKIGAGGLAFAQETTHQLPNRFKEVVHLETLGYTVTTVWDGENGWVNANGDVKKLEDKVLAEVREALHMSQVLRLVPLRDKAVTLSLLNEIQVDGRPAVGVKVTSPGRRDIRLFFDKANGQPVKLERQAFDAASKKEVLEERFLGAYKDFEGRKWPTKVTIRRDGKPFMETELIEVKVLPQVEANVFAKPTRAPRPQEPKRPFPYVEEEVTYENRPAGVKFAGTFTRPRGTGPFAAVLLITGSGPQDRDEAVFGHRPFLVLADYLTRRGVGVLRVDDRGVGGSTGNTMEATSEELAADVLAGLEFLKKRADVNPRRIGLIGHSEGGLIAPFVAVRSPDVAFIVMMAGPGLSGEEILYRQGAALLKSTGADERKLARQRSLQERLFTVVKRETDRARAEKALREVIREESAKLSDEEKKGMGDLAAVAEGQLDMVLSPWFRFFLMYDPRPTLMKVRCPVLAVNGEKDVQVLPRENLAAIGEALKAAGNKDYTVKELPGLNHLFQTCRTGALAEYSEIEETIAPAALEVIGDWVVKHGAP